MLLLGLQGSGKTTTAGKLGRWLARQGRHPLLVSTDVRRPAAIQQLTVLGQKAELRVHDPAGRAGPGGAREGRAGRSAQLSASTSLIVDTAGRLHIDDALMTELEAIKAAVEPTDLLYVADAMTGQDAIKSAGEFNRRVGVTGVVLTQARWRRARRRGALGRVGRRRADRVCRQRRAAGGSRGLPSRPRGVAGARHGRRAVAHREGRSRPSTSRTRSGSKQKLRLDDFTLEDFRDQLRTIRRRWGPLESILGMIPGMGNMKQLAEQKPDEKQLARVEAIINSMTPGERRQPRR